MTDVSIVICTRNRVASLVQTLVSLADAARDRAAPTCEVVVVDNGSSDGTSEAVQDWAARAPMPVILVREGQPGLARARNTGIARSSGRLLMLTDDDCRLAPDYLVRLLQLETEGGILPVWGGRVDLGDVTDLPLTIKTDPVTATYRGEKHPGGFIHGCNMAMPRSTFDVVGAFDPRLGAGTSCQAGEDTDFIYRAYLAGATVRYCPELRVTHFHGRKKTSDANALLRAYGRGNGALYLKHAMHWNLLRNFYWDLKGCLRQLRGGPPLDPVFGFSYGQNVRFCLAGAWRFALASVQCMRQNREAA